VGYLVELGRGDTLLSLSQGLYALNQPKQTMRCFTEAVSVGADISSAIAVFDTLALSQACMSHVSVLLDNKNTVTEERGTLLRAFALRGYVFNQDESSLECLAPKVAVDTLSIGLLERVCSELAYTTYVTIYRDWLVELWRRSPTRQTLKTLIELNVSQLGDAPHARALLPKLLAPFNTAELELAMDVYAAAPDLGTEGLLRFVDLERANNMGVRAVLSFVRILLSVDNEDSARALLSELAIRETLDLGNDNPFLGLPIRMLETLIDGDALGSLLDVMAPLVVSAWLRDPAADTQDYGRI
jgi:hypothetical protein